MVTVRMFIPYMNMKSRFEAAVSVWSLRTM